MTPLKVAVHARALGTVLQIEHQKRIYKAPPGVINEGIVQCLKAHKQALLKLMASPTMFQVVQMLGDPEGGLNDSAAIDKLDDLRDHLANWFDERAGIHGFEANLSRGAAENRAMGELQFLPSRFVLTGTDYVVIIISMVERSMTKLLRKALKSAPSLNSVAVQTGVQKASLMRFVRGDQSLRLDVADKLAAYFNIECRQKAR